MTKINKKTKWKYGVLAIVFSLAFIAPELFQFVDFGTVEKTQPKSWFDPRLSDFFYDDTIDETSYNFNAQNQSYITCKIHNTPYANFTLDNKVYNVSYGMNYIPIDFGNQNKSYTVTFDSEDITNDVYDWFVVQPVFVASGDVVINPSTTTDITFDAGGLVSLFLTWNTNDFNNFTYDELYIEYDGTVINEIREDWDHEFEICPVFLSSAEFEGQYMQYDIFMNPGSHTIKLKGNATVYYMLVVSGDWDEDGISNQEEIQKYSYQKSGIYHIFDPVIWGHFEKSSSYKMILDENIEHGLFTFTIPRSLGSKSFRIELISGSIQNITIDEDSATFKNKIYSVDFEEYPESIYYGSLKPGRHIISYKYSKIGVVTINFYANGRPIVIREIEEISDKDCDNSPDLHESWYGTNPLFHDTDYDLLPDGFDSSPTSMIKLNVSSEITEIVVPHNSSRDTLVSLSIATPQNDYTTKNGTMIWKDMEVSIFPTLRLFGNSSIGYDELENIYEKELVSYNLVDSNQFYGDSLPVEEKPNLEFTLIKPELGGEIFTYDFTYDIDNPAKSDSKIVIRFDIVWGVFSHETESSRLLHFYEIDELVILQSVSIREIDDIYYIMASPDSMIENEILFNLVQNSNIGSFSDFNVDDDVSDSGFANYTDIFDTLIESRENNPISVDESGKINETEVTYFSYVFSDYDVLKNITNNLYWTELDEYQEKTCKLETFAALYTSSDISEVTIPSLFDPDTSGALKICYTKSFDNYSESAGSLEERFNIIEYPVYMNNISFQEADVLEITFVNGYGIPLDKLPSTIYSQIHDKISYTNITLIENKLFTEYFGAPKITFDIIYDIKKITYDTRILEVSYSDLLFNSYSKKKIDYLKLLWHGFESAEYFRNGYYTNPQSFLWWRFYPEAWDQVDEINARLLELKIPVSDWKIDDYYTDVKKYWKLFSEMNNNQEYMIDLGDGQEIHVGALFPEIVGDVLVPDQVAPEPPVIFGVQEPGLAVIDQMDIKIPIKHKFITAVEKFILEDIEFFLPDNPNDLFAIPQWQIDDDYQVFLDAEAKAKSHAKAKFNAIAALYQKAESLGPEDLMMKGKIYAVLLKEFKSHLGLGTAHIRTRINALEARLIEDVRQGYVLNPLVRELYQELWRGLSEDLADSLEKDNIVRAVGIELERKGKGYAIEAMETNQQRNMLEHRPDLEEMVIENSAERQEYIRNLKKAIKKYLKIKRMNLIEGALNLLFAGLLIWSGIVDSYEAGKSLERGDIADYKYRMTSSHLKWILSGAMIISTFLNNLILYKSLSSHAFGILTTLANFFTVLVTALTIVLDVMYLMYYLEKIEMSDNWTPDEKLLIAIGLTTLVVIASVLAIATAVIVIVGASVSWVPVLGLIVDIILVIALFLLFPQEGPMSAGIEVLSGNITIPENDIKKHGSLEIGDLVELQLDIKNTGTERAYMQLRMNPADSGFSSWDGDYSSGYSSGQEGTINVSKTLSSTSSSLDILTETYLAVKINDVKTEIYHKNSTSIIPIPILDNNITDFHSDLEVNPNKENQISYFQLMKDIEAYKKTFNHNITSETANKLSSRITHDFLSNSTGETPTYWNLATNDDGEHVVILRPDADVEIEWDSDTPHWSDIDDEIYAPTAQVREIGDFIFASSEIMPDDQEIDVFNCTDPDPNLEIDGVKSVKVWIYGSSVISWDWPLRVYISFDEGDTWSSTPEEVSFPDEPDVWSWECAEFIVDESCDLKDFQIKVREPDDVWPTAACIWIDVMYAEIVATTDYVSGYGSELVDSYKSHNNIMNITCVGDYEVQNFMILLLQDHTELLISGFVKIIILL